jgi:ABC-2 type transport system ATP-binding protein
LGLSVSETVIEISHLSKHFKEIKAVDDLSFNVYKGDVFGFLGPNGAGKSTTIRMLLTLISPDSGSIKIFGQELVKNRLNILRNTGAIIEKPDFYGYMTAYKNLEILSRISGKEISRKRIMEVLELVGLESRYKSKVKTFSHGMKQRLGLAQALLHNPELIILDEPTTGLDPQGMKEIRDLITMLSKEQNKTILLSSHLLNEIEMTANRMIIINKGNAKVEGDVRKLLLSGKLNVKIEAVNGDELLKVITGTAWEGCLDSHINNTFIFNLESGEIPELNKYMVTNNIEVVSIVPTRSLEEYFLSITEGGTDAGINKN